MFAAKERLIFSYYNGTEEVFGDPIAIQRRINHYLPKEAGEILCKAYQASDPEKPMPELMPEAHKLFEATNQLVEAIRISFPMVAFDPATSLGANEQDCLDAWEKFQAFLDEKKNGAVNSPTSLNSGAQNSHQFQSQSTIQPTSVSC